MLVLCHIEGCVYSAYFGKVMLRQKEESLVCIWDEQR